MWPGAEPRTTTLTRPWVTRCRFLEAEIGNLEFEIGPVPIPIDYKTRPPHSFAGLPNCLFTHLLAEKLGHDIQCFRRLRQVVVIPEGVRERFEHHKLRVHAGP